MRSPLMDELSGLDPARHVHAPGSPWDSTLQEILVADRNVAVRQNRRHPGLMAGAAAGAAVALAAGVTWAATFSAPAAYATWTPVPATTGTAAGEDACPTFATRVVDSDSEAQPVKEPVAPVLAEVRGDYTYVVQVGDGAVADCFVSVADGEPVVFTSSTVGGPVVEPGQDELVVLANGVATWSEGGAAEGAVTSAYGRAGADVRAVTVTLDDGEQVEATVGDGWWMVWAPGADGFTGSAEVTLDDGTTTQVPLETAVPAS